MQEQLTKWQEEMRELDEFSDEEDPELTVRKTVLAHRRMQDKYTQIGCT